MSRKPSSNFLLSAFSLCAVVAAAGVLSCSTLRQFYAPDRPDGNMREIGTGLHKPAEKTAIRLEHIADMEIPVSPISMALGDETLYLAAATYGMATVDLRVPHAPKLGAIFEGIITPKDPRSRSFLSILPEPEHDRLLVLDRLRGVNIWDASDPLNPQPASPLDLGGGTNEQALVMKRIGKYYYLPSGGRGLLRVGADLENKPRVENILGAYDHTRDITFYPPHWLLVSDGHDTGMQVLDISDESHPKLAHVFSMTTYCDQIVACPPYVLMGSRGLGMAVVDMSRPERPFFRRFYFPPPYGELKSMLLWRDRYLIACGKVPSGFDEPTGFIRIYDMKNPAEARLESEVRTPGEVNTMVLSGDHLVASLWNLKRLVIYKLA